MIRTRFAPSPTGSLHVGNTRIAVLNWLFTRRHGGRFLLRIEDTDVERNVSGSEAEIFRDLRWLGLDWDEGPAFEGSPADGEHGPYRQSERLPIHREWAQRLVERDLVYPCFCTDAEIEQIRVASIEAGGQAVYDGRCARLTRAESAARQSAGVPHALRFRITSNDPILVYDAIRGEVRFEPETIGDFVVLRSDGRPTYNFAVVVDDISMEITHVLRGSGHLSNTPRQQLLYAAFERAVPVFAHVPMVLGPDRQKLSKRHGAKPVAEYRTEGWHPDALVNYLSLLSWSSPTGEEFLMREQLVEEISLDRIGAADVIFDPVKLHWLGARHIERLALDELLAAVRPFLDERSAWIDTAVLPEAVAAVRTHLAAFGEINDVLSAFAPPREMAALAEDTIAVVRAARDELERVPAWEREPLEQAIRSAGRTAGTRGRALYEPLRIALTGEPHGPPFTSVLIVQGRARVLAGLDAALRATR